MRSITTQIGEKFLFGASFCPVSVIVTWATMVAKGMENASLSLLCCLCICHYITALPLKSSFAPKTSSSSERYHICDLESMVQTAALFVFPGLLHVAVYHRVRHWTNGVLEDCIDLSMCLLYAWLTVIFISS